MTEPVTIIGVGAVTAYLAKDGLQKLLGPTAEYLGQNLQQFVERRHRNLQAIFEHAQDKAGASLGDPGAVPPRVLKVIVDEGSYADDRLTQEYFGGVLASARSPVGRDDRGARIAKLLEGLSAYQIRAHYLLYSAFLHLYQGKEINVNQTTVLSGINIFFELTNFASAMEFSEIEVDNISELLPHVFFGLAEDGLISASWNYGPAEYMAAHVAGISNAENKAGLVFRPSKAGIELFCWGIGAGHAGTTTFLTNKKNVAMIDRSIIDLLKPSTNKAQQ